MNIAIAITLCIGRVYTNGDIFELNSLQTLWARISYLRELEYGNWGDVDISCIPQKTIIYMTDVDIELDEVDTGDKNVVVWNIGANHVNVVTDGEVTRISGFIKEFMTMVMNDDIPNIDGLIKMYK